MKIKLIFFFVINKINSLIMTTEQKKEEEEGHYILYGEWKLYDDDGVCGTHNDTFTEIKNWDDAVVEYNKMVKDNENEMRDDYDLIYLDYIDEDGEQDNFKCWERPVLIE